MTGRFIQMLAILPTPTLQLVEMAQVLGILVVLQTPDQAMNQTTNTLSLYYKNS